MSSIGVRERIVIGHSRSQNRASQSPTTTDSSLSSSPSEVNAVSGNGNGNVHSSSGDIDNNRQVDAEPVGMGQRPWLILGGIFVAYAVLLFVVYMHFPEMSPDELKHFKIPRSIKEARALGNVLEQYKNEHYWTLLIGLALFYIFLQTFAIPGSIFLSIMAGFLFPFWTAMLLVCFCSATGASFCYMLSWLVARRIVETRFQERIRVWSETVEEQRDNLINFIIFLRITPILPNWFINIAAPFINIPLSTFWFGTFIGVAPPSILAVNGGSTLNVMTSPTDHISWTSICILALIAIGSLVPVFLRRR